MENLKTRLISQKEIRITQGLRQELTYTLCFSFVSFDGSLSFPPFPITNIVIQVAINKRKILSYISTALPSIFKICQTLQSLITRELKILSIECGRANRRRRIIGGTVTKVNEYPWQVAIVKANKTQPFCGGALIDDEWIMTAAHCTQG